LSWIPGWDSIASTGWWSGFYFWVSIAALIGLGVAEIASHRYSERKDELAAIEQEAKDKRHDEEMTKAQHDAALAIERAAGLEREAAILHLELDREIQKRAQRIAIIVENDIEARAFSIQFFGLFGEAGAKMYAPEAPPADKWFAPAGLIMYSPVGSNEAQLKDDPLYRALKAANLFGGTTGSPFLSGELRGPIPAIIPGYSGHVLYIGEKSPF
jgi:hypothetical protein